MSASSPSFFLTSESRVPLTGEVFTGFLLHVWDLL